MTSIAQINENEQREIEGTLRKFFIDYRVRDLLKGCRAEKQKGHSAFQIFRYLLCLVFCDRSMYMQIITGRYSEAFGKNTVYRFLNSARTNWERLTCALSARIINGSIRKLTGKDRQDVFIIDDSLFKRTGGKKTELCSRVFDHVSMKYKRGFRLLTLAWSDGNSLFPILGRLLGSSKAHNMVGVMKSLDQRSLAARRRKQALSKATDVMLDMLKTAIKTGHNAKYVLFDTWFANPKDIIRIHNECGLNTIAMIKKSSKVFYEFDGKRMNIKQIYGMCKKRRGRSKYLLSVKVNISLKNGESLPAKIVCVRNRNKKKDWIAFICTDTNLSEEEILRIYGKRWDIEVFFKTCKSMLNLGSECHSLSYDALTAHVSLVFIRYMLLSLQQRNSADDRTISELFLLMIDELEDITFGHALQLIVDIMLQMVQERFGLSDDQLTEFMNEFIDRLPNSFQHALRLKRA
ncbi:MAG: transposase [Erysipelotrichaceae bacterium]|nr:transposase [Erysipelotrichaceae bacterium]